MGEDIQVRVLYDFDGQEGSGELSVFSSEILTVTRKDVGEGWWEGTNSKGQTGLFPAAYVEVIQSNGPPSMPPPPLPDGYNDTQSNMHNSQSFGSTPNIHDGDGDWDEDWDDDDSTMDPSQHGASHADKHNELSGQTSLGLPGRDQKSSSTGDVSSVGKGSELSKSGSVRRNLNRFSVFVKSGGEAYILGQTKIKVDDIEKVEVLDTGDGISWAPSMNPYKCILAQPKKETKLKGLKSFIAYQLTPTFNNIQVSRRYKHFDWLHQRLDEKFALIPIPPLPDKQISGRYEEQFIEHRMLQLQSWVDRICSHPVLGQSEVWKHFITCTDEKKWKVGKRRAEKDELIGASFFLAISVPPTPLDPFVIESETENGAKFTKSMDDAVKNLQLTILEHSKKHSGAYKREFQKLSHSFKGLANSFELHSGRQSNELTSAMKHTADTYDDIGKLYEDQPRHDLEPLGDVLHEYKGMLSAFPDILTVHRGAMQKRKEYEKLGQEGKADGQLVSDVCMRTNVVSYAAMAEINHFHQERMRDFQKAMQLYLQEQIKFYEAIVGKLQNSLSLYDID